MEAYDIVVIGAGAGGLVTAAGAARLKLKVAVIEKHRFGGECLWTGCVPSKALIRSAKIKKLLDTSHKFGLRDPNGAHLDFAAVMARKDEVIRAIEPHDNPKRFEEMGVDTIAGEARFTGLDTVQVGDRSLKATYFVLATGADAFIPPIPGLADVNYLTFETFFDQRERPKHLMIIGAGPIGMEMAQTFRRLGSQVTVLEAADGILVKDDPEMTAIVRKAIEAEGVDIRTGVKISRVSQESESIRIEGEGFDLEGDRLLIATGKRPRTEGLGLDKAGVKVDRGRIVVNDTLRTTNPRIYAVGDAAGKLQFTHWAEHAAGTALVNMTVPFVTRRAETNVVPWCTYVDPEIAHVGEQAAQAGKRLGTVKVWKSETRDNDRHIIEDETEGRVKIVTDRKGVLLGATIVSPGAGEMIHEYALAVKLGARIDDISSLIHAYPTLIQANKRASDQGMAAKYLGGAGSRFVAWNLKRKRPKV